MYKLLLINNLNFLIIISVDNYIYEMKNAVIGASTRTKKARENYNLILQEKHKLLMAKFEADCSELLDEITEVKSRLAENENFINDLFVQQMIRKLYIIKMDFSSKNV